MYKDLPTLSAATSSTISGYTFLGECAYHKGYGPTYGDGNYARSSMRIYLNDEYSALNWSPQHDRDTLPSYADNSGFLWGLDEDFKNVLGAVKKKTYDLETREMYETEDKVFLLSRTEVYGGDNIDVDGNAIVEGTPYEYYKSNSSSSSPITTADSIRIKYSSDDTAYGYYLRSNYVANATQAGNTTMIFRIACVSNLGAIASSTCVITATTQTAFRGIAPCCCIV
jgi:hypothetical protein